MRTTWAGSRVTGAVAAVLISCALAGCSGSASSGAIVQPTDSPTSAATSPSDGSPTSEAPPTRKDGCPYLTAEKVTATLGAPTEETAGTVNACFFDPEGGSGPSVQLSRVDVQIDPADYARHSRLLCKGAVTDVDAGDMAFACVMGLGPQGQVYVDRVLVNVAVNDAPDEAAGIALAAALLPEVTIPPSAR